MSNAYKILVGKPEGKRSWDNSVVQQWIIVGLSPFRGWEFFPSPPHPDRLWGPPSLLFNGYWGLFCWGVKLPGHETDNSPPPSAEVKNALSYTSTLPIHLHGMVLS
jgi:hypothetical protein